MSVYIVVYTNRYHEDGFEIGGVYPTEERAEEAGEDQECSTRRLPWDNYSVVEKEVQRDLDHQIRMDKALALSAQAAEAAVREYAGGWTLGLDDLESDYEGPMLYCPVCREKKEQDAEESPGYVPLIYLSPAGVGCYECGTDYDVQITLTEADDGAE